MLWYAGLSELQIDEALRQSADGLGHVGIAYRFIGYPTTGQECVSSVRCCLINSSVDMATVSALFFCFSVFTTGVLWRGQFNVGISPRPVGKTLSDLCSIDCCAIFLMPVVLCCAMRSLFGVVVF